jgi:hypothetical protein
MHNGTDRNIAGQKISLYFSRSWSRFHAANMEHDLSLWGIFAMPVGLVLCFGPALLAWIRAEVRSEDNQPGKPRR